MADSQVGYVIDCNAFSHLTGENRIDRFTMDSALEERVWEGLESLVPQGRLVTSSRIRPEMRKWCPKAYARVRILKGLFLLDSPDILAGLKPVFAAAEMKTRKYIASRGPDREVADPYLISIAMLRRLKVVTGELSRSERAPTATKEERIPDWCPKLGVIAIHLGDLVRDEGWG